MRRIGRLLAACLLSTGLALCVPAGTPARAQGQPPIPVKLDVPAIIVAQPASKTRLAIEIEPAEAIPKHSFLRIRGLPTAVTLTEGHAVAPGSWAVPLKSLASLHIAAPAGSAGKTEMTISLVAIDGAQLAEAKSILVLTAASALVQGQTETTPAGGTAATASPGATGMPAQAPVERPAARAPPPAAGADTVPAEARERALRHKAKGDEQLAIGDIAAARLLYQKAVELGLAPAALALAATYDPEELARLKVRGVAGDPALARQWYEKARELGAGEAADKLRRLGAR